MKRLIIICEGATEQEFCRSVLGPHLLSLGIYVQSPLIKKSHGGIVKWTVLKRQIENHIKGEREAYITTLIDFYGIRGFHQFEGWNEAKSIDNINDRMDFLESRMKASVLLGQHKFIPYIQLHEFEGLLFNTIEVFDNNFMQSEFTNYKELVDTIDKFHNPEMINDGPNTAPSKRLERLIIGYNKVVYGTILAEEIGLARIRSKSPRFNNWISSLEAL